MSRGARWRAGSRAPPGRCREDKAGRGRRGLRRRVGETALAWMGSGSKPWTALPGGVRRTRPGREPGHRSWCGSTRVPRHGPGCRPGGSRRLPKGVVAPRLEARGSLVFCAPMGETCRGGRGSESWSPWARGASLGAWRSGQSQTVPGLKVVGRPQRGHPSRGVTGDAG